MEYSLRPVDVITSADPFLDTYKFMTDGSSTCIQLGTVEFHLSGLTGKASHPDMQKIRITRIFFENRLQ
jgi:hypothetical protein